MGKAAGIRVSIRFRPMNKVESQEDGNHICVKISACRRALRICHPDRPDRPSNFYFDQIYPPGVTQEDAYNFTGRPLVDTCIEGFNATIFAFGQTGSGKTFSMMGVLGTDNRGLVPRIIEDIFTFIENLPETNTDEYTVQIMMCEIYMERIKDLFNSVKDNMKVREDKTGAIFVEGITEIYCGTVDEVLDNMDNGFMNRATSATRMNAESSRSHCVVMIKTRCTKQSGSTKECTCKMVDLAGSEKTKKTAATGQRLEEAKTINQSLTALGQVLNALSEGGFIPYRNSKLTRLLQDALGGNSVTSLMVAASPCSYNAEETISALRFGERAKKVKNKPKINEDLTVDEYKKLVQKLEAKVGKLERENKLMKLKLEACQQWIDTNGGSFEGLVKDIKIIDDSGDGDDKPPDVDFDNAMEIKAEAYVIDKKTGKVVCGDGFSASIKATPDDIRQAENKLAAQQEEAQLDAMVAQQYDLNAQRGFGGGGSSAEVADLLDQIDDLKAELRGCEAQRAELERTTEQLEDQLQDAVDEIKIQHISIYQYKMFKAKAEFLERECGTQLKKLQMEMDEMNAGGAMIMLQGEGRAESLEALLDAPNSPDLIDRLKAKLRELAAAAAKAEAGERDALAEVDKMKSAGLGIDPDILDQLQLGDGATKKALMEVMKRFKDSNLKLMRLKDENDSLHKQNTMLTKRDDYNEELRNNWRAQLQQMEQAVMLCSQIHQKERGQYEAKLASANNTIQTLKDWIQKIKMRNNRTAKVGRGGTGRIRMPVGNSSTKTAKSVRKGHKTVRRKRRKSRDITADQVAAKKAESKERKAKRAAVQAAVGRD